MNSEVDCPPTTARGTYLVPVLVLLELISGLIQGWIIPLLGRMADEFEISGSAITWLITIGLLSSAVSVPLLTVLADRYGRKPMLVISVASAAAGTLLIAIAPSFAFILVGAVLQGPVAAWLPIEMALLRSFRPDSAKKIIGYLVGCLTVGLAIGALGGGLAMDAIGVLVIVQLIPAAAVFCALGAVVLTVPRDHGDNTRSVDWAGAGALGVALVGIMYGLSVGPSEGWDSAMSLVPLGIGGVALVVFIMIETRVSTPLLDVRVIRRGGLFAPLGIAFFAAVALFGNQAPTSLYLTADPSQVGYGVGTSPSVVGLVISVTALVCSAAAFASNAIRVRIGERVTVAIGSLLIAAGVGGMTVLTESLPVFITLSCVSFAGIGIIIGVIPGIIVAGSPASAAASLSGVYNTLRTLGGSLAGAAVAAILAAFVLSTPASVAGAPSSTAFQVIWVVFAAVNVLAALLAFGIRHRTHTSEESQLTVEKRA